MSDQDDRRRARRRFGRWVLGLVLGWVVLVSVETQVVKYLDRQIRADRTIFTDYVARLPERMYVLSSDGFYGKCETHRVGYLWFYQICLTETPDTQESRASAAWGDNTFPCKLPYFWVNYIPPRRHLAVFKSEWVYTVFLLEKDKQICSDTYAEVSEWGL